MILRATELASSACRSNAISRAPFIAKDIDIIELYPSDYLTIAVSGELETNQISRETARLKLPKFSSFVTDYRVVQSACRVKFPE